LKTNDLQGVMKMCEKFSSEVAQLGLKKFCRGPFVVRGSTNNCHSLTCHGFVKGCSPGTALRELLKRSWISPEFNAYEYDLSAAYESISISDSRIAEGSKLFPISSILVRSIIESPIIIKYAILDSKARAELISNSSSARLMWHKQFPAWSWRRNSFTFSSRQLIQGSPLSPVLFNYLLSTFIGNISGDWIVYGDNFYGISSTVPIPGLLWKDGVQISSGTLGLKFSWTKEGSVDKLLVYSSDPGYRRGVQRLLNRFYNYKKWRA